MPDGRNADEKNHLSPEEMRQWADQEIRDSAKAHELRTRELTDLVNAYSAAQITPEQADERMGRYQHRWGEALRGTSATEGITDEQILAKIDATRKPFRTAQETSEGYRRKFGSNPDGEGPARSGR